MYVISMPQRVPSPTVPMMSSAPVPPTTMPICLMPASAIASMP
jgi:hypothetical protein